MNSTMAALAAPIGAEGDHVELPGSVLLTPVCGSDVCALCLSLSESEGPKTNPSRLSLKRTSKKFQRTRNCLRDGNRVEKRSDMV